MNKPVPPPSYPNTSNNRPAGSPAIVIAAIVLFALSGLCVGFAVGALTHKNPNRLATTPSQVPTVVNHPQTATTTPSVNISAIGIGCPVIDQYVSPEVADGNTSYVFKAHAVDKSGGCGKGQPIRAAGITFRLWLLKQSDDPLKKVPDDRRANVSTLAAPFPDEVQGLKFDSTTQQVQNSDNQGQVMWKYQVASSVSPGAYYLVVLSDWQGQRYNWSWGYLTITK